GRRGGLNPLPAEPDRLGRFGARDHLAQQRGQLAALLGAQPGREGPPGRVAVDPPGPPQRGPAPGGGGGRAGPAGGPGRGWRRARPAAASSSTTRLPRVRLSTARWPSSLIRSLRSGAAFSSSSTSYQDSGTCPAARRSASTAGTSLLCATSKPRHASTTASSAARPDSGPSASSAV